MVKPLSSDLCQARWATPRRPERRTLGPALAAVAEQLGQPLMPWQRQVADVGLELLPDGRPAYRSVTFTVPRQSGKTTLILSWEVQRAIGWAQILGQAQRILYSAQTGKDAREKLLEDQVPILEPHKRLIGVKRVTRTNGSESVLFTNGSRLGLLASGEQSGHGKTLDLGIKDELFADADMRRDQAMNPAMATRPHAQAITASTMGTAESLALNAEVDAGRAAVENDLDRGVAYFEWSAWPEDDPSDPQTWWRCMPALGRTITLEVVEDAYRRMSLEEFKRAYLNIPTASDDRVIPAAVWARVCDPEVEATAGIFAFDVNPERSAAGIVAIGAGPIVEVTDYRPGTGWLVPRIEELSLEYGAAFALDRNGPAGSFVDELKRRKVKLIDLEPRDMPRACGSFFDKVTDDQIAVRQDYDLDAAVAGAVKRPVGDAWVWGRKPSKVDISLLVAASVGLWAFEKTPKASPHIAGDVDPEAYDAALRQIQEEDARALEDLRRA